MRALNRLLRRFGICVVPIHTAKMLHEYANVVGQHHPSHSSAAIWLRTVARYMPYRLEK